MRVGFCNKPEDCQWLRDTHLKGRDLPAPYDGFQSFVLQGPEDNPYAINLYVSNDPLYRDHYYRVHFPYVRGLFTPIMACEYDGATGTPCGPMQYFNT